MNEQPPVHESSIQRAPLTVFIAAFVALAALFVTTKNGIMVPVAVAMLGSLFIKARLDGDGNFVRLGRYAVFGFILWQAYDYVTSPTAESPEMVLAYTIGYLCALEMAIQTWIRRPASGARSPATILLSAMVFLAASNTLNQSYIRFFTPLYFLFLSLSWRAFQPAVFQSRTFWKRGAVLAGVLGLSAMLHGGVWHYRNEISNWGMQFIEGRSIESTGLSTDPYLSSSFNIRGSTTRMLRLENADSNGQEFYLRVAAFCDYEANRWLPQINHETGQIITPGQVQAPEASRPLKQPTLRITRLTGDQQLVFAPLNAAGFLFSPDTQIQWSAPLGPLQTTMPDGTTEVTYEIQLSQQEDYQGFYCKPPDADLLARYRQVSKDIDPRVRELARTIGASAKTDAERISAVGAHLLANHHYSLKSRFRMPERTSEFLLNKRDAHCEYFASGGAILLRCLGVPCRYVIGYVAHESDGANALVVRGRDAHAWIECWIDNHWVTADFTPGDGRPEGRAQPLPLKVKISEWFQKAGSYLRVQIERLRKMPLRHWLVIFAGLILILLWSARNPRRKKERRDVFTYASRDAELSLLASRFEKWLQRQNAPCPPGLTWPEHLRRAGLEQAQPFAARYEAARFGRAESLHELHNLLQELERKP